MKKMKKVKDVKKLSLQKETVVKLNQKEMLYVKGGYLPKTDPCGTQGCCTC